MQADQTDPLRSPEDPDPVAGVEHPAQLAVDADGGLARVGQHPQGDGLVRRGDDAAVEGHVGRDGSEDDRVHVRGEHGTAGGEAVGGRSGGGGDGEGVRRVGGQPPSGEIDADADLTVTGQFLQDDVVQGRDVQCHPPAVTFRRVGSDLRRRQGGPPPVAEHGLHRSGDLQDPGGTHGQRHPFLDDGLPLVDRLQRPRDVGRRHLGEEPDLAEVDTQHVRTALDGDPGATQEGAVATERDDEVRVAGRLRFLASAATPLVLGPDVDLGAPDSSRVAPVVHGAGGIAGRRPPLVDDQADTVHGHSDLQVHVGYDSILP